MYTTKHCSDCRRAKLWLSEHKILFLEVAIDHNEEAIAYVQELNNGANSVPTIIFSDDSILVEPSNKELEEKILALQKIDKL